MGEKTDVVVQETSNELVSDNLSHPNDEQNSTTEIGASVSGKKKRKKKKKKQKIKDHEKDLVVIPTISNKVENNKNEELAEETNHDDQNEKNPEQHDQAKVIASV